MMTAGELAAAMLRAAPPDPSTFVHVDYPHHPGRLYCPACEAGECVCTPETASCVSEHCYNSGNWHTD